MLRVSGILFVIVIFMSACSTQPSGPAPTVVPPTPAAATALPSTPAFTATSLPAEASTATPAPTATPTETFTPTVPPPAVIGLDNYTQLVQLHDYTPDLNAITGKQAADYAPYSPVFSPDSQTFAVPVGLTDNKRALYILDVATGDLVSSIPLGDSAARIYGWAFNPDGQKLLFSTYPDGKITVWDIAAQKVDRVLFSKKGYIASDLAATQDGKQITAVVGDVNQQGAGAALMVWDAASGDLATQLPADTQYGVDICKFSADGSRLIVSTREAGK